MTTIQGYIATQDENIAASSAWLRANRHERIFALQKALTQKPARLLSSVCNGSRGAQLRVLLSLICGVPFAPHLCFYTVLISLFNGLPTW
jgi:hypothetical protein